MKDIKNFFLFCLLIIKVLVLLVSTRFLGFADTRIYRRKGGLSITDRPGMPKQAEKLAKRIARGEKIRFEKRNDLFVIYFFFRVADDIVDILPSPDNKREFFRFKEEYYKTIKNTGDPNYKYHDLIKAYIFLHGKYSFEKQWVEWFFDAMEMDLSNRQYHSLDELYEYTPGASEFTGRMWCRYHKLGKEIEDGAAFFAIGLAIGELLCGVSEDIKAQRVRLPVPKTCLKDWSLASSTENPEVFIRTVRQYLLVIKHWVHKAEGATEHLRSKPLYGAIILSMIKIRKRIIKYIYKDPFVIYQRNLIKKKISLNTFSALIRFGVLLVGNFWEITFSENHRPHTERRRRFLTPMYYMANKKTDRRWIDTQ